MTDRDPFKPSAEEIARRYRNTRNAMARLGLDAAIISGSAYTGFEGAVRYMCGFQILHRYAYVVVPMEGGEGIATAVLAEEWVSLAKAPADRNITVRVAVAIRVFIFLSSQEIVQR